MIKIGAKLISRVSISGSLIMLVIQSKALEGNLFGFLNSAPVDLELAISFKPHEPFSEPWIILDVLSFKSNHV